MRYPTPLARGTLLVRYKRFLADVLLDDGRAVTAHVPNSGAMTGCAQPGSPCYLAPASNPARRLPWTLELVIASGIPVGVNTARANRLGEEALADGTATLSALGSEWTARREVRLGDSRIDLCLEDQEGPFWVEIKSVTWTKEGVALFPDAPTRRGVRHLAALHERVRQGARAALLYVVQRGDATAVRAAGQVDPAYAEALARATAAGVEARAVQIAVAPSALMACREIPVLLDR